MNRKTGGSWWFVDKYNTMNFWKNALVCSLFFWFLLGWGGYILLQPLLLLLPTCPLAVALTVYQHAPATSATAAILRDSWPSFPARSQTWCLWACAFLPAPVVTGARGEAMGAMWREHQVGGHLAFHFSSVKQDLWTGSRTAPQSSPTDWFFCFAVWLMPTSSLKKEKQVVNTRHILTF